MPRDRFVDAAAARTEIERRGGKIVADKGLVRVEAQGAVAAGPLSAGSGAPPLERWTFVAHFEAPGTRGGAERARRRSIASVEIRDARETLKARVSELIGRPRRRRRHAVGGRDVPLPGRRHRRRAHARDRACPPRTPTCSSRRDRPRDHLPTLFLALAVAVFGVVNLGALARGLRR